MTAPRFRQHKEREVRGEAGAGRGLVRSEPRLPGAGAGAGQVTGVWCPKWGMVWGEGEGGDLKAMQ